MFLPASSRFPVFLAWWPFAPSSKPAVRPLQLWLWAACRPVMRSCVTALGLPPHPSLNPHLNHICTVPCAARGDVVTGVDTSGNPLPPAVCAAGKRGSQPRRMCLGWWFGPFAPQAALVWRAGEAEARLAGPSEEPVTAER